MNVWHSLLRQILRYGQEVPDRTGVGTLSLFAESFRLDISHRFPAVTTKRLPFKAVAGEMACFISGSHNVEAFRRYDCKFWDVNGEDPRWREKTACQFPGDLGRIYGTQWRFWRGVSCDGSRVIVVDQLAALVRGIQDDPHGRRHIVTAWNPAELDQMCLPPCPMFFQCYVRTTQRGETYLDMHVYQRSCDAFLGLPCDIAGYALLLHLIAIECKLKVGMLAFSFGDVHIYRNHIDAAMLVHARKPFACPTLDIDPGTRLFGFDPGSVRLRNYESHPAIAAELNN